VVLPPRQLPGRRLRPASAPPARPRPTGPVRPPPRTAHEPPPRTALRAQQALARARAGLELELSVRAQQAPPVRAPLVPALLALARQAREEPAQAERAAEAAARAVIRR